MQAEAHQAMLRRMILLLLSCTSKPWAHAFQIENLDQGVGGPKATATLNDFILENDRIRVAVLDARYSLGPSPFGGTIADVDLQRSDPMYAGGHGKDAFAEMFSTVNMNLVKADTPGQVSIVSDGSNGPATIRADGGTAAFLSLLDALWAITGQPDFRITTDYILEPGSPALKIVTTASLSDPGTELPNAEVAPGNNESMDILGVALFSGFSFGDFYLQGGSVDVFTPGLGFDEDQRVYEAMSSGKNTFKDPFKVDFVAGVADGVSYAVASPAGSLYIPIFTSSQTAIFGASAEGDPCDEDGELDGVDCFKSRFAEGGAFSYERYLGVGKGDVGSALDALIEAMHTPHGNVYGQVVEEGTGIALSQTSVLVYKKGEAYAWSQWLSDVGDDTQIDGSYGGMLPPGDYELQVHQEGRPEGPRVPITVTEGKTQNITLTSPRPGSVYFEVVDESGRSIPAKITVYREDGKAVLNPDAGDPYIAGDPAEVWFAPYGSAEGVLPPGEYHAVATRGTEYDLGISGSFTVARDGSTVVPIQLNRAVFSDGWVTADFHVHAINSFDSGTRLSERVVTMVCEGIEFFTSSDHDFVTDYAPVVEDLGLEPWVKTGVGLETTTLEIGHFIGFPLENDTVSLGGGAFDWTGMAPTEIMDTLGQMGKDGFSPVRMVAHPRDGILGYFDQYGWSPYSGEVETPLTALTNPILTANNFTLEFDALELMNGKRFDFLRTPTQPEQDQFIATGQLSVYDMAARTPDEQDALSAGTFTLAYGQNGQIDDWFSLLNLGHFITALANSDTHGKFSVEAGCPHNYVQVAIDDPTATDAEEVADAVKAGKVVASYGPFIRFWVNDPANGPGSIVQASDGQANLHIEVEAPTWIAVDRVEIYRNGTLDAVLTDLKNDDSLRLAYDYETTVDKDSWFVVIALGNGSLTPVYSPVEMPPVELQDVVTEALGDVPGVGNLLSAAIPIPRTGNVIPYALTNPVRVDVDGGDWTPPGIAPWMVAPPEPAE